MRATLSVLFLLAGLSVVTAQTNEFRFIGARKLDVNSGGWMTVTIPAGSGLQNEASLHFDGTLRPQTVVFQIPAIYNFSRPTLATIQNFPYTPALFRRAQIQTGIRSELEHDRAYNNTEQWVKKEILAEGLVLNKSLSIRVWPLSKPVTNYDAVGTATVIPARPVFDYGIVQK